MVALRTVHEHGIVLKWDRASLVVFCVADIPNEIEAFVDLSFREQCCAVPTGLSASGAIPRSEARKRIGSSVDTWGRASDRCSAGTHEGLMVRCLCLVQCDTETDHYCRKCDNKPSKHQANAFVAGTGLVEAKAVLKFAFLSIVLRKTCMTGSHIAKRNVIVSRSGSHLCADC
jgi:hypothetical protein